MSQSGSFNAASIIIPPTVPQAFVTDAGIAIPAGNILNVFGAGETSTSGAGNTVTINTPFNPNKVIRDFDDFIGSTGIGSKLGYVVGSAIGSKEGTAQNPGILTLVGGGSANSILICTSATPPPLPGSNPFKLGAGQLSINWVFDLVALSIDGNSYTTYIGISDAVSAASTIAPVDGVFFRYNHAVNGGKWQIVTSTSSVTTALDSGVLASTGFHSFGFIINATATSVSYFIDHVLVATGPITTNIPLTGISPVITTVLNAGVMPTQEIDLFYYEQILTTAR